jgi:hypothetical protein
MLLPDSRIRQKSRCASRARGAAGATYTTQSASERSSASASRVARTPSGPMPASSPASLPSFAAEWTQTPASSRFGRSAIVRIA